VKQFWICDFGFWIGRSRGRIISSTLAALFFALCSAVEAQQQTVLKRIGWLGVRPIASDPVRELFGREFRALGYVEGKNIIFEYRSADDKLDRLPALADDWSVSRLTCSLRP
jgi:hypothetical protein